MKRTFGVILTIIGITGVVYAGACIMERNQQTSGMFIIIFVSLMCFFTGLGLFNRVTDDA